MHMMGRRSFVPLIALVMLVLMLFDSSGNKNSI